MPDGGDPCKGYAALKAERDRLTIIADAIQAERDRLRADFNDCNFTRETLKQQVISLRAALEELVDACEYVKPFAGAVAVKASVKDIRKAGSFVKAVEIARRALEGKC
jgi:hypothetical protein